MSAAPEPRHLGYILDDDPGIRTFVCRLLDMNGYDAYPFDTVSALLGRLGHQPPDVLILDLALGQSDAVEVIRHLEAVSFRGKVLLISGKGEPALSEIRRIGLAHGLTMLPPLPKPFRAPQFVEALSASETAPDSVPQMVLGARAVFVELADAMANKWLELWYQPKLDLKSRSVGGAEALLRVRHPEFGIIPPAGFLPPSSDLLHHDLAKFIMRQVALDWSQFADLGCPLKLAVNMPVSVISAPGFIDLVRACLPNDPRFPGLIVEVTEDEDIADPVQIKEAASQLSLYNVQLSVDDFGTAYSSLSRFLDLSFAEVKLDRSFVSGCASEHIRRALCQTVVDLAHRFNARACAEGVETAADLETLTAIGCDVAQGYFIAKPIEPVLFANCVHELNRRFALPQRDRSPNTRTGTA